MTLPLDPSQVRVPAGVRWDCGACGKCCRGYTFGPIEPEIIAGLEARDIGSAWPLVAEGFAERRPGPDGQEAWYFRKVDDHCVFLQDDNLCAIHARFGAEAKPGFCREFPFHLVQEPTGLVAVVRADCGSFHHSFESGTPIEDQLAEVLALPRAMPVRRWAPAQVPVLPGVDVPIAAWPAWEQALLARIAAPAPPEALVAGLRAELAERAGRPDAQADPARLRVATGAVLAALQMVMQKVLATEQAGAEPKQVAFARAQAAAVEAALAALPEGVPPLSPEAERYARVILETGLLSKELAAFGGFAEWAGHWLFGARFVRLTAPRGPDGAVDLDAFAAGWTAWRRFATNGTVQWVLGKAAPALVDVYRNAR